MCGIAGFIRNDHGADKDQQIIREMTSCLRLRGPDDEGYYVDDLVVLGHRRLSIIDLSGGRQPIANEDGSVQVILNGEIYNYRELRKELLARGHSFRTHSDTECIAHLYEEKGADCLQDFNGIFAFAIWDSRRKVLLLARDRLGVKPLHYCFVDGQIIFASEIKSILAHPSANREIDRVSLAKYLVYEYVPAPHSIYRHISKLLPGQALEYQYVTRSMTVSTYWQPDFVNKFSGVGLRQATDRLQHALQAVVSRELISDVPVGLFLSGGLDSSALAAHLKQTDNIDSFCMGFAERSFDESKFARVVTRSLGMRHHEYCVHEAEARSALPEIALFLDEPLGDASIIPTFLLCRFARASVKVALGGDGGDELFAGYDTYQAHRLHRIYSLLPEIVRVGIHGIARVMPVSTANLSLDFRLKKFVSADGYSPEVRNALWLGSFVPSEVTEALVGDIPEPEHLFEDILVHRKALSEINDPIERIQYLDLKMYLQDDILVKVDRASMANSMEVRVPLLNHELVDIVTRFPVQVKLRGLRTKYLLREHLRGRIPRAIVSRKKKGFGFPIAEWIKCELKEQVRAAFDPIRLKQEGFFNPKFFQRLLKEHWDGKHDHRKKIWTAFMFQLWLENHGRS